MTWEIIRAFWGSARLEELTSKGWEPFAVVCELDGGNVVYLRRSHVVVVDAHVRLPDGFDPA